MSRARRKTRKSRASRSGSPNTSPQYRPEAHSAGLKEPKKIAAQVEDLLSRGRSKEALAAAKVLYAATPSPSVQALLVRSYGARVSSLLAANLLPEAEVLLSGVERDFPDQAELLDEPRFGLRLRTGHVADVLTILKEPESKDARCRNAETALRRWLMSPADVAHCAALPGDHPLRLAAADVDDALTAVTSRPMSDEELALSEVSRKSPFAPWKPLVRAIAAFYRGEDATARALASAVPSDSAPAPLAGTLEKLLSQTPPSEDSPARNKLFEKVLGYRPRLIRLFNSTEAALTSEEPGAVAKSIPKLIEELTRSHRPLVTQMCQRLVFRAIEARIPRRAIERALGGPVPKDAFYWCLLGNHQEKSQPPIQDPRNRAEVAAIWFEFLFHAIEEGTIQRGSLEEAAVLLKIARICRQAGEAEETLDWKPPFGSFRFELAAGDQSSKSLRDRLTRVRPNHLPTPFELYGHAAEIARQREIFQEWAGYVAAARDRKREEVVLSDWRESFPEDVEPLRRLANLAEARGALRRAADLIEEARRLDSLSSDLRRSHWRVTAAFAFRHLKQKKGHLAAKDLEALGRLEDLTKTPASQFAIALRAMIALVKDSSQEQREHFEELARGFGDDLAAEGLLLELARCSAIGPERLALAARTREPSSDRLSRAAVKICSLARALELPLGIPEAWQPVILADRELEALGPEDLRLLAEAAERQNRSKMSFTLAGAGMRSPSSVRAELVFLRAKSLPDRDCDRKVELCRTAAQLARRRGDEAFAALALNHARDTILDGHLFPEVMLEELAEELDDDEIEENIDLELRSKTPPAEVTPRKRRRRRRRPAFDFEDWDDLDDDLEFAFDDDDCMCASCVERRRLHGTQSSSEALDIDPRVQRDFEAQMGMPSGVIELMVEVTKKFGEDADIERVRREDPELFEQIARTLEKGGFNAPGSSGTNRRRKNKRRR